MVRRALRRAVHLEVREDTSGLVLERLGIEPSRIARGIDSAFALADAPAICPLAPATARAPVLGVTVRDFLDPRRQMSYERAMATFIDWASTASGLTVRLLPQVVSDYRGDDDRIVARRVAARCSRPPELVEGWNDHDELRAMYGHLDYLVGTRFHSVVFSLLAGVPALAIEYEHKTSGIMADLGLERWVLSMAGLEADELIRRFEDLTASRAAYRRHLDTVLPPYRARARAFTARLRALAPAS